MGSFQNKIPRTTVETRLGKLLEQIHLQYVSLKRSLNSKCNKKLQIEAAALLLKIKLHKCMRYTQKLDGFILGSLSLQCTERLNCKTPFHLYFVLTHGSSLLLPHSLYHLSLIDVISSISNICLNVRILLTAVIFFIFF